jgi:hypothetical protein
MSIGTQKSSARIGTPVVGFDFNPGGSRYKSFYFKVVSTQTRSLYVNLSVRHVYQRRDMHGKFHGDIRLLAHKFRYNSLIGQYTVKAIAYTSENTFIDRVVPSYSQVMGEFSKYMNLGYVLRATYYKVEDETAMFYKSYKVDAKNKSYLWVASPDHRFSPEDLKKLLPRLEAKVINDL